MHGVRGWYIFFFFTWELCKKLVGNFCCAHWGKLSTHLCLNVCAEFCFSTWFHRESLTMHHKQIPYIPWLQHQSQEYLHGPLPAQLCCPKVSLSSAPEASIPGWLQTNAETISYHPGKLPSLVRSPLSLAFLLPESLTPSCSWTSCPLCQIILQSQITSAELSPLEFFTVWLPLPFSWFRICYKLRKNILNSL